MSAVRRGLLGAALGLSVSSCQLLFGDFELEQASPAKPSPLQNGCEPNTFRCDGDRLETCAPDRSAYVLLAQCGTADLCDPTAAACRACTPGESACNGATPLSCDSAGHWIPGVPCASAALCRVSADRRLAACTPPSCAVPPGAHECHGELLLRCSEEQDRLELADRCTSEATCDAALADAQAAASGWGTCVESAPEPCESDASCTAETCATPGEVRCVTNDVTLFEACGNAGRWVTRSACATEGLCSAEAARCLAPACEFGEQRCLGQVHQKCAGDRSRWIDDETCGKGAMCVLTGCAPASCTNDTFRCNGPSLERCASNQWIPVQRCASAKLCSIAGSCGVPMCGAELGNFRCKGTSLEQCAPERDAWADFRYCPGGCRVESDVPICDE